MSADPIAIEAEENESAGHRRCIVSGETEAKCALVRFVAAPDGTITPDVDVRLPGRGIWVGATRALIEEATKKRLFARAAKQEVRVPEGLADLVESLIAKRMAAQLGLAKRAGMAVSGFDKVEEFVASGTAGLVLIAAEASPNGREKMVRIAGDLPRIEVLGNKELSLALGRENVVHAAVARGTFVDRLTAEALRLAGFRQAKAEHGQLDVTE